MPLQACVVTVRVQEDLWFQRFEGGNSLAHGCGVLVTDINDLKPPLQRCLRRLTAHAPCRYIRQARLHSQLRCKQQGRNPPRQRAGNRLRRALGQGNDAMEAFVPEILQRGGQVGRWPCHQKNGFGHGHRVAENSFLRQYAPVTGFYGYRMGDTIVALATAPLPAGVAVIRLSGPDAWGVASEIFPPLAESPARKVRFGPLAYNGVALDEGLVVGFRAPASFTGEDVVEIHTHGGRAVVQAVLDALLSFKGIRMALAGEFTRRAVLNGKLDLTAAEGLADLIAADTEAQRRQALRQLDGALGERFEGWRSEILRLLAQVEAAIDFPDEELDVLGDPLLAEGIRALLGSLQQATGERAGQRVRDGISLAIVGRPNAGKSTFLNLLAGREVAIVSPLAGTTRDVVTSTLDIGGYPVTVADTAGLRLTDDVIEAEGVRRARLQAERADVLVAVLDGQDFGDFPADVAGLLIPERTLIVASKADLVDEDFPADVEVLGEIYPVVAVNLTEKAALPRILASLEKMVSAVAGGASEAALLTRERHRAAVQEAVMGLGNALIMIGKADGNGTVAELVAQDLRDAASAIGTVTGRTSSEDVLDVVFSTFCIGK